MTTKQRDEKRYQAGRATAESDWTRLSRLPMPSASDHSDWAAGYRDACDDLARKSGK